jgi:hypothetical protein
LFSRGFLRNFQSQTLCANPDFNDVLDQVNRFAQGLVLIFCKSLIEICLLMMVVLLTFLTNFPGDSVMMSPKRSPRFPEKEMDALPRAFKTGNYNTRAWKIGNNKSIFRSQN